jgi:AraC-like DNA-binding protein
MAKPAAKQFIRGTLDALRPFGIAPAQLGLQERLDRALQQSQVLFMSDTLSLLWARAARATGNPELGLDAGRAIHPAQLFGLLYHRAQAAPTLGDALRVVAHHVVALFPAESFRVVHQHGCTHVVAQVIGGDEPVPMPRYDFGAQSIVRLCRLLLDGDFQPVAVNYPGPGPASAARHEHAYGASVRFGTGEMSLVLRASDFERPLPSAHPTIAALLDGLLNSHVAPADACTTAQVKRHILLQLRDGDLSRRTVAQRLAMTERTLQRWLAKEGTSFAKVLDQTRRELAQQYLAQGVATPAALGYALGFADPSSVYKAWHRWFGNSPGGLLPPLAAA